MNAIFLWIFVISTALLLFFNPDSFLTTVLNGASKSATLCLALVSSYALWLGLINVWEKSGLSQKIARLFKPLAKKLFKTQDEETISALSMSLSVNLLGIGGASTPYGIKSAKLLDKSQHAEYSSAMLFVINATSIQLLPTAIVGVRASLGSIAPADIILPSILETAVSTLFGVLLTWGYFKLKSLKKSTKTTTKTEKTNQSSIKWSLAKRNSAKRNSAKWSFSAPFFGKYKEEVRQHKGSFNQAQRSFNQAQRTFHQHKGERQ